MSQGMTYAAGLSFLAGNLPGSDAPRVKRWHGHFYLWTGTHYRSATDEEVKEFVSRWLARNPGVRTHGNVVHEVNENLVRDVMLAVRSEAEIGAGVEPGTWIGGPPQGAVGPFLATPGGVIDLGRLDDPVAATLHNDPDFFALSALAVAPDTAAPHPRWDAYLAETFGGDLAAVNLLQEAFGYSFWPDCRFERFFLFPGPANAGKSTAVETLQAILGPANHSAITLERLGDRFSLAGLVGKLANIVTDASEVPQVAEGVLKSLVSGEPVPVEEKHQPVRTMRVTAKHFVVGNVLPRFHDTSGGMWRRVMLLPFARVRSEADSDPGLKSCLRAEAPGIAHWALRGLARLLARKGFERNEASQRLIDEYRRESNPVALFLAETCEADPDGRVGRQALYASYKAWVADNGHKPLSSTRFYREVGVVYPQPDQEVRAGRGGDRQFVGFRVSAPADPVEQLRLLAPPAGLRA